MRGSIFLHTILCNIQKFVFFQVGNLIFSECSSEYIRRAYLQWSYYTYEISRMKVRKYSGSHPNFSIYNFIEMLGCKPFNSRVPVVFLTNLLTRYFNQSSSKKREDFNLIFRCNICYRFLTSKLSELCHLFTDCNWFILKSVRQGYVLTRSING